MKHALEEIGRAGKGDDEVMKALQEFLGKERRMPLRILAAQTISKAVLKSVPLGVRASVKNVIKNI